VNLAVAHQPAGCWTRAGPRRCASRACLTPGRWPSAGRGPPP